MNIRYQYIWSHRYSKGYLLTWSTIGYAVVFTLRTQEESHDYINKCLMDLTEVGRVWIGFNWLRLGSIPTKRGLYWTVEQLSSSQEEPCTMHLTTTGLAQWYSAQLRAGLSGIRVPEGAGNFSLHHRVQTGCPSSLISNGYQELFPSGVNWPGREVDHSPPSSAEVKKCTELYLHSSNMPPWRGVHLQHRDTFTMHLTCTSKCVRYRVLILHCF
jgi:hypothetical protein